MTSFGGHPKVSGNGYVPYYMVFDQHGNLVHHHMCGAYHGGDGLKMIELVDKLLKESQAIYLGREPFQAVPKLAARIGAGKKLGAAVKEVEKRLATAARTEKAELERLQVAVVRYRDQELERAEALISTQPSRMMPALADLAKEFAGCELAAPVVDKLAEYKVSADLKRAIAVHKSFVKLVKRFEKLDAGKRRDKALRKITKLAADNEALPIAKTIREYVAGQ